MTAEQQLRDALTAMGFPEAQELSSGDLMGVCVDGLKDYVPRLQSKEEPEKETTVINQHITVGKRSDIPGIAKIVRECVVRGVAEASRRNGPAAMIQPHSVPEKVFQHQERGAVIRSQTLNPPQPGCSADLRLHPSLPLNPPPEPEMTFSEWYEKLGNMVTAVKAAGVDLGRVYDISVGDEGALEPKEWLAKRKDRLDKRVAAMEASHVAVVALLQHGMKRLLP